MKRRRRSYDNPKAGERIHPVMTGYKLACCDCGLVHKVNFRVVRVMKRHADGSQTLRELSRKEYKVAMRIWRLNRSTAAVRRERKKRGEL